MSVYRKKVFPVRLPQSFHGDISAKHQSIKQRYLQKASLTAEPNPQMPAKKIVNWQIKKKNNDIVNQRKQFLTHTGKVSHDMPTCFQSTNDFYRRNELQRLKTKQLPNQGKNYDVLNRKRFSVSEWKPQQENYKMDEKLLARRNSLMQKSCSLNISEKIGHQGRQRLTGLNWLKNNRSEVTPKIGSVQNRDYSIKRPQLKIGKDGFIDTYSPF